MITLPLIIELCDYDGNIDSYESIIHEAYLSIFKNPPIYFNGKKIIPIVYPKQHKDRHWTFSHMTSVGDIEDEREFDLRRCERVVWVKPILTSLNDKPACLKIWRQRRNSRNRIAVWYEKHNFLIILQEETNYFKLVTTIIANGTKYQKRLEKEYEEYMKAVKDGKANAI